MLSLKTKQSGFTIVELLIVIVIIGILAGLVITTFVGIQARGRDSERQTDIKAIQGQLEAYYANNGGYPAIADLNSGTWRSANKFTLDIKALADPKTATTQSVVGTATTDRYLYTTSVNGTASTTCVSPTDGATPPVSNSGTICNGFSLSATSEVDTSKTFSAASQ